MFSYLPDPGKTSEKAKSRAVSFFRKLFGTAALLVIAALGCNGPSSKQFLRLNAVIDPFIAEGKVPGVVALILRDGKPVYEYAAGWADWEARRPMTMDTIFRVASHTKALTTVAALMLIEEGKLSPETPVGKFIPSFYYARVAELIEGAPPIPDKPGKRPTKLMPLYRHITIHHLLTHTSGISYGLHPDIADDFKKRGFGAFLGHAWYITGRNDTICEASAKLGRLPLKAQPGARWIYGYGTDILGCIVEKVSGMPLDEFFHKRITDKLGMEDTHFYVESKKKERLAVVYDRLKDQNKRSAFQGAYVDAPPRNLSGGSGLVSTAHDYARFLEMIRRGGEYDGERYLKPESIALMTTNQVGARYEGENGGGFGYGFEIAGPKTPEYPQPQGAYGWYGILGTFYRVYPKERLVIILYTQLFPRDNHLRGRFMSELADILRKGG